VLKVAAGAPFADLTPAEAAELRAAAEPVSADELIYVLRAFLDADVEMRRSPHPRVELEIAAVRATRRPRPQAIETLIGKLEEAETRLRQMPAVTGGAARPVVVQETLLDARPSPASASSGPRASGAAGSGPATSASASLAAATPSTPRAPSPPMAARTEPPASRREPESEALIDSAAADIDESDAAAAPSSDLEMAWERVIGDVLKRKALLGSVLQHASPLRVEQGVLTLALQASGFHREMLNDRGNKELINEAVQRHVASARRFELDTNAAAPAGGGGARNHPAVQAALSTFQSEVVAVRPRSLEEGESR
jgi:hypothetical protein